MATIEQTTLRLTDRISPTFVVFFQIVVFLGLTLAVLCTNKMPLNAPTPAFAFEYILPLWIPWAGALGGMTISLVGVARHNHEWNAPLYGVWHLLRPLLGGVSGTVAVLAMLFVLRTLEPSKVDASTVPDAASTAVMVVISFVIGYREETFRELIKRVVDLILATPPKVVPVGPLVLAPAVLEVPYGGEADGTASAYLMNSGTADAPLVDATIIVTAPFTVELADSSPVAAGSAREIQVTCPQGESLNRAGILRVAAGGQSLSISIRTTAP